MRKKLIAILFAMVTIVYIIIGALLFLNIQLMESPEILIKVEVTEVNSEEAILHTTVDIDNPNSFEIVAKNLELVIITPDGYVVARLSIEGGEIGSHEKKTFTKDVSVAFDGYSPELLTSKITGEVGANILFIQKTIPLNIGVVTSIENLINELAAPSMSVMAEFVEITTEGINFNATMDVYNPNTFEIYIENISTEIEIETGKKVGDVDVIGGVIAAKGSLPLNSSGTILFEALNAEKLVINMSGVAGAKIVGFKKNLSFNIQTRIMVPDLEELLLSKDKPTILSIKIDKKLTLKGIVFYVSMEINNSYKVDLLVKDIVSRVYTADDDGHHLIGENDKVEEIFAGAGASGLSECEVLVPFSNLFPIRWSTDWIMVSVSGNVTIKGVNQSVYLEVRGYHDIHLFR
jgi:LEA14-like dessication related protein